MQYIKTFLNKNKIPQLRNTQDILARRGQMSSLFVGLHQSLALQQDAKQDVKAQSQSSVKQEERAN